MKKYFFQYVFFIILAIGMIYSPVAYAEDTMNTVVNSIVAIVEFIITDFSLIKIGCDLAGGCDFLDDIQNDFDCRIGNFSNDPLNPCPEGDGGFIATVGVSDTAACLSSARLTFYNDVGPNSPSEANSNLEIYRFTLPKDATYWPFGGYSASYESTKSAAIINWMSEADQKSGNGLFNDYDYKSVNYFLSNPNLTQLAPYATVPYSQACDTKGVCKILDQSIPEDLYIAYLAKTDANYDFKVNYDDKVIYDIQEGGCPSGYVSYSNSSCRKVVDGYVVGYSDILPRYINYNGGTILVKPNNSTGPYYITDANGNKIFAVNNQIELKESEKLRFNVSHLIQGGGCPDGYVLFSSFSCRKVVDGYVVGYSDILPRYINYNGGTILVKPNNSTGPYYITDANGNKIFAVNNQIELKESEKLRFNVSHLIQGGGCPSGYALYNNSYCREWVKSYWGNWYSWGYGTADPLPRYINYNGGTIPVKPDNFTGPYYITDANSNKIFANDQTFTIKEGTASAPKFKVTYSLTSGCPSGYTFDSTGRCSTSSWSWGYYAYNYTYADLIPPTLTGYNGGTYISSLFYSGVSSDAYAHIYFSIAGKEYKYTSGMTTLEIPVDEFTPVPTDGIVARKGKFLSVVSGLKVTDTTSGLPTGGLTKGNDLLGPFKPITDEICFPPLQAPVVIQTTGTTVTLEVKNLLPLNLLRRLKGSGLDFMLVKQVDFSLSSTFTDTDLTPHTTYEYALQHLVRLSESLSPLVEAYTLQRPNCKILASSQSIAEFGSVNLSWQCNPDTVPISCQIQSDDPAVGVKSGLSSAGAIKISPSQTSRYALTCLNVDGSTTASPLNINLLKPGIKEVKP